MIWVQNEDYSSTLVATFGSTTRAQPATRQGGPGWTKAASFQNLCFYGLDCRNWFLLFIILQLTINDYNWNWCLFFIQSDFLLRLERPKNWNCFWNCNINLRTISIIEIISQMSGMTFVNKKYATVILEARIKTENSNLRHLQQKRLNHIYYDKW